MGDGYRFEQSRDAIVAQSVSDNWDQARPEWRVATVYDAEEPKECLCGYSPIVEICVLRNQKNRGVAEVGNVCVKRFLGIDVGNVFAGLKRVSKDLDKALNADAIEFLHERDRLTDWEAKFYFDTWRKRDLSDSQLAARRRINTKVLAHLDKVRDALLQHQRPPR
jgi:hypothetical protein